jgi:hypothetical protein
MSAANPTPGVFVEAKMFGQDFSAVFDDNGKVAYAFLLYQELGHDQPPHLNIKGYAKDETYPRIEREDEIEFRFITPNGLRSLCVELYLRGELFAKLVPDQVPGWSKMAAEDSDLARALK